MNLHPLGAISTTLALALVVLVIRAPACAQESWVSKNPSPKAVKELVASLSSDDESAKLHIVKMLQLAAMHNSEAKCGLVLAAKDRSVYVRILAAESLTLCNNAPELQHTLLSALESDDDSVRLFAIESAGL